MTLSQAREIEAVERGRLAELQAAWEAAEARLRQAARAEVEVRRRLAEGQRTVEVAAWRVEEVERGVEATA